MSRLHVQRNSFIVQFIEMLDFFFHQLLRFCHLAQKKKEKENIFLFLNCCKWMTCCIMGGGFDYKMTWNGQDLWSHHSDILQMCLFLINDIVLHYRKTLFLVKSIHVHVHVRLPRWRAHLRLRSHYYTSQAGSVCYGMWHIPIAYTDHCVLAITVYIVVAQATKQWWPLWESYSTVGVTEEPFNTLHCRKLFLSPFFF